MAPDTPRDRLICLRGCDADTEVVLGLTDSEFEVIQRLVEATAAASGCEPKVLIP